MNPDSISIIVPTRHRRDGVRQLLESFRRTTSKPDLIEIIFIIDDDDTSYEDFTFDGLAIKWVKVKAGLPMGALNMTGYRASSGAYVMLLNDDVELKTQGWDDVARNAFHNFDDGIVLIHVNDRLFEDKLCTFPFMTREMCERMGGICPEGYRRYRIDDHIYNVFNLLSVLGHNRILYLPELVFEHHHISLQGGGIEYQPNPEIHAIDTELFDRLLQDRKHLAVELAGVIDARRARDLARVRGEVLAPITDSVSLRRPEYVRTWRAAEPPSSKTTRVTIGIVSADVRAPHAQACIAAVKKFTSNFDLVVLDNNRGPNFNHAREMNRIIAACRTDYLVLMDDDAIVEAGWLDGMLRCVGPETGIVTPLHRDADGALSYAGVVMTPDHSGHHTHAFAVPNEAFAAQTMCSAIFLIDMGKVGHLRVDESYSKYFLDIEYGLRVWETGYKVICSPHTMVTHIGGATLTQGSQLSNQLFEEQRRHFVRAWIETGRYQALERSSAWREDRDIGAILDAPARLQRLLQRPDHNDKQRYLEEAHAFFEWLSFYPAMHDWVRERLWAVANAHPADFLSADRWHEAALIGQIDYPVLIEPGFQNSNLILWRGHYFAAPPVPFDGHAADRGTLAHLPQASRLSLLKIMLKANFASAQPAAIMAPPSAAPGDPFLLEEGYQGFNILLCNNLFFALDQSEGEFDYKRAMQGGYRNCYKAQDIGALKELIRTNNRPAGTLLSHASARLKRFVREILATGSTAPATPLVSRAVREAPMSQPLLVEEGFRNHNIVQWGEGFYALAQGDGAFDAERAASGAYLIHGNSLSEAKMKVNAELARAQQRRLMGFARRVCVKLGLAKQIVQQPELIEEGVHGANIVRFGDWYYAVPTATGARALKTADPSAFAGLPRAKKASLLHVLLASAPSGKTDEERDSRRWVASSPATHVGLHRGFAIYRYEFKYFAIPAEAGSFSYAAFKKGDYPLCPIGHAIPEVERLIDRIAGGANAGRTLVFASIENQVLKQRLDGLDPAHTDILATQGVTGPAAGFGVTQIQNTDLFAWARSAANGGEPETISALSAKKYDTVVIPWRYPETWRDNSLETAASKISDFVEVRTGDGGKRGFYGENLHRLLYNKAYLCSMFEVVPQPAGKTVLEVGCSDGMVCDVFALLGAKRVVGIDVMETVGCSYKHPAIEYRSMEADRLGYADNTFDIVYSIATLEHVPRPEAALNEITRVLKPGGYAYVQAAPLYHSPYGHHMFAYFMDEPWIHLRKSKSEIRAYALEHGIDKRVARDFGVSFDEYLDEMLNFDHVNGLFLSEFGLDRFQTRTDIEVLKFVRSSEGVDKLTPMLKRAIPKIPSERLTEHGFEIAFTKKRQ